MRLRRLQALFFAALSAASAAAAEWPPISEEERKLSSVPGFPEATAVVLLDQGRLELSGKTLSSFLDVYTRIKVLKPEGKSHGTVTLLSSEFYRMKELEARVHLPGGEVLPLPPDAKFEKRYDGRYDQSVVSFALPQVGPGAIVEYRYRLYFDSVLFPAPWYFQDVIPTRRSEIVCSIPKNFVFKPHLVRRVNREVAEDVKGGATGMTGSYVMTDAAPVPDEPASPPFADLASRITFIPVAAMEAGKIPLCESWESLVKILQGDRTGGYEHARKHAATTSGKGKRLGKEAGGGRAAAEAIYRFVRDEIASEPLASLASGDRQADDMLAAGSADPLEKALLLQIMLEATDVESSLGWTRSREDGAVEPEVVNPGQFDAVVVAATIDGKRLFLDPAERRAAFGVLPPDLEGVRCLLVDGKDPEWVTTPVTASADSARRATVSLEVGADGAAKGKGTLTLSGNHAWERLAWAETKEKSLEAWRDWIASKYPGFDVSEVGVEEAVEERRVAVTFQLSQRADEAGDEASLKLAAPLAQERNPFSLTAAQRITPVRIPFPDSDAVEVTVTWPAGYKIVSQPKLRSAGGRSAKLEAAITVDDGARKATYTRRFDTLVADVDRQSYGELASTFAAAVANDAELLVVGR